MGVGDWGVGGMLWVWGTGVWEGEVKGVGRKTLVIAATCSGVMPVKQNIPIWSVMCCQLRVDPLLASPSLSCVLIVMILSAMVFTSTNHSALSSGFVITSAAILAPCLGGLLYKGLTMILT